MTANAPFFIVGRPRFVQTVTLSHVRGQGAVPAAPCESVAVGPSALALRRRTRFSRGREL